MPFGGIEHRDDPPQGVWVKTPLGDDRTPSRLRNTTDQPAAQGNAHSEDGEKERCEGNTSGQPDEFGEEETTMTNLILDDQPCAEPSR